MKKTFLKMAFLMSILLTFLSCQKESASDFEEIYEKGASLVSFGFNITTETIFESCRNPLLKSLKSELPDSVMITYVKTRGPHGNPNGCVLTTRAKIYLTPSGLKSSTFYLNPGWYKLINIELKATNGNIVAFGAYGNEDNISKIPDGETMGRYFVIEPFSKPCIQTWVLPTQPTNSQVMGFAYVPKNSKEYLNIPTQLNLSSNTDNFLFQSGEIHLLDKNKNVIDKNILISGSRGWIYINRNLPKEMNFFYVEYQFGDKVLCTDSINIGTQVMPLTTNNSIETNSSFQLSRTVIISTDL